ncbi:MAG: hypothetical protein ABR956_13270 [Terracidiphilus sp.]
MKTYVFGAGASLHAGYPLAKRMGHGLFAWLDGHDDVGPFSFRQTAMFLREYFDETEDIEKLITAIEEMITSHQNLRPRPNEVVLLCNCHKPALIAAIRMWFEEIRLGEATDYARFASGVVAPGDCVLTFNYDVSLEPHLMNQGKWRLGDGYGFGMEGFENQSPVKMLKLHGSVNWRFPAGWNGRPWIDSSEIAFLGYLGRVDSRYSGPIADTLGTMILPARCKQFFVESSFGRLHERFWDGLWSQAGEALRRSDEVMICGYSVPGFDKRACELLLNENYPASIEVCCGDDTQRVVGQLRSSGRNARAAEERHFDGWLNRRLSGS